MARALVIAVVMSTPGCAQLLGIDGANVVDAAPEDTVIADVAHDAPIDMVLIDAPSNQWGNIELVPTGQNGDQDPTLSADMLEMFFSRNNNIHQMTRASLGAGWSGPVVAGDLSSGANDVYPELSPNGLALGFASSRAGGQGGLDVWGSLRSNATSPWTPPVRLGELSSNEDDYPSSVTTDGLRAIIASNRQGTGYDLFESVRASTVAPFGVPVLIISVSSASEEAGPHLSPDGLTLHFSSDRNGSRDIFVTTRTTLAATWSVPEVVEELVSNGQDSDPWVSADGRHIYFSSDRGGNGLRIYHASR